MAVSISASALARLLGRWQAGKLATYRALADALRRLILDGRLSLGQRLPGERSLARGLSVSRTTVSAAFAILEADGFLKKQSRSQALTALPFALTRGAPPNPVGPGEGLIDFASATLAADPAVYSAYAEALSLLPSYLPGHGYEPLGCLELRVALAQRYGERGLATAPEEVMVTGGALNALALILRTLKPAKPLVLIEHPTYPQAIDAILAAGGRPLPVPIGRSGWDLELMTSVLASERPAMAYIIADHQNPTGRWMTASERKPLVAAAKASQTLLVFDETLRELALGPDRAATHEMAEDASDGRHVVRIGSASKTFWGGLRIGWIRAQSDLIAELLARRGALDLGSPVLEQLAVARLLASGEAILERRREALREQRDHLVARLRAHVPELQFDVPSGGLCLWVELDAPIANALAHACERQGLRIAAGPRFGVGGAFERYVRFPFSASPTDMDAAVKIFAQTYRQMAPRRARGGARADRALVY